MSGITSFSPTVASMGRKGGVLAKNNSTDLDPLPKCVEVVGEGTVNVLPYGNADGDWVDLGTCTKGYRAPFVIRRINTSSTATIVGIWD